MAAPVVTIQTPDQAVGGGATVSLSATASDPDGGAISFEWLGNGTFSDNHAEDTDWTAPSAQQEDQDYTLTLTVNDTEFLFATASVTITVTGTDVPPIVTPNNPDVSIQTGEQSVDGGATVNLSASASDPGGQVLSLLWSGSGTFSSRNVEDPVWTAPAAALVNSSYQLRLTATNQSGLQGTATVTITVLGTGPPVPVPGEGASITVVIHTPSQAVDGGSDLALSATVTVTPGVNLGINWTGRGTFDNPTIEDPTWTAPAAEDGPRPYTLSLAGRDGGGSDAEGEDRIQIIVRALDTQPTLTPIADRTNTAERAVNATFAAAVSGNGVIAYSFTGLPPGLVAIGRRVQGTPTTEGVNAVTMRATDEDGDTVTAAFTWTIAAAPPVLGDRPTVLEALWIGFRRVFTSAGNLAPDVVTTDSVADGAITQAKLGPDVTMVKRVIRGSITLSTLVVGAATVTYRDTAPISPPLDMPIKASIGILGSRPLSDAHNDPGLGQIFTRTIRLIDAATIEVRVGTGSIDAHIVDYQIIEYV